MSQYKDSIDIFSQTSLLRVNRLYIHILLHPTPVPHVSKVVTKPPELFFVKTRMYFMRFSTCKQLDINDHLKAHLWYKSCPRTLGTEDLVYAGTRTQDLVVESPVP